MAIVKTPDQKTPKKKESAFRRAVNLTFVQFTSTTTIHGLKHINDTRGNRFTRCFWILIPFACFLCAIALMATFLLRYKSNPTRINVETNFGPIDEIEFPAVTFCNPNFITLSRIKELNRSLETYPDEEVTDDELIERIKFIAGFTNPIDNFDSSKLPYLQQLLSENRFDVQTTMKKLMFPCSKLLYRCRWEGVIVDCKTLFSVSETYQGYCCSFNIFKPSGSSSANKTQKIRKTQFMGPEMGLSVILNPLIEKYAMASVNSEGIKIMINEFNLFPGTRAIERMLPHRQETFVEVRPERTDCSDAVSSLPISDRGCVFSEEVKLKYFPTYMEENCLTECNMKLHIKTCECLPYFFYNTQNDETCNFLSIKCMVENRHILRNSRKPDQNASEECVCPSQCKSQAFTIRISSVEISPSMPSSAIIDPFHQNVTDQHMIVHVYFVSQVYRVFIRSLLTNFISLISNLGGVYSLLIGMSMLSAIEVLYYSSIRLYMNYRSIKNEDMKPKTFSERADKITISSLKVPRLDTAKSSGSDMSHLRMTAMSHF